MESSQGNITEPEIYCKQCGISPRLPICEKCYRKFFSADAQHVSHAFDRNLKEFAPNNEIEILDLMNTSISKIDWKNLDNIKTIRLSHCENLTSVSLLNCRALKALDLSYCNNLKELKLESTYNVKALDLTGCQNLTVLDVDLMGCEYISIAQTKIKELSYWPLVKYLDISGTPIDDISFITSFTEIQVLRLTNLPQIKKIDLGPFTHLQSLASIECDIEEIDFTDVWKETRLTSLYLKNSKKVHNFPSDILRNYNGITPKETYGRKFEVPFSAGDWTVAYRLLYGPFAPPPNDVKPIFTEEELKPVIELPESVDKTIAANQICGALFGAALGDSLGLAVEVSPKAYINYLLENPIDITWTHMKTWDNPHYRAAFTDDTALSLPFMESIVKNKGQFDPKDLAKRIQNWINNGIAEHHDGRGIGSGGTTRKAVAKEGYLDDPIKSTEGMETSGNGGVMRTAPCGCFKFWDIPTVAENAANYCKLTHNCPPCVYASVLISVLVAKYIQQRVGMIEKVDIDQTIDECFNYVSFAEMGEKEEETKSLCRQFASATTIDDLNFEEKDNRNLKTMGGAIWVLRKGFRYAEGVEKIIRAGGDTDTNAAVAGAVLGARWGFDQLPIDLLHYFFFGGILKRDVDGFLSIMGLEFHQKEWNEYPGINFPDEEDTIIDPFAYQKFVDEE